MELPIDMSVLATAIPMITEVGLTVSDQERIATLVMNFERSLAA